MQTFVVTADHKFTNRVVGVYPTIQEAVARLKDIFWHPEKTSNLFDDDVTELNWINIYECDGDDCDLICVFSPKDLADMEHDLQCLITDYT